MQHKVEICGVNTSKLKVLKSSETQALLLRAKAGDAQAREELIAGNLRLVLSVIQRFANRGENNFNTDLDVKFSTYGVPMIVGEIRRYLRDNSTMRVSRAMRDTAYKVLQAKEAYMAQHQKEPSVDEIAKILGIKREDVVFALDAILEPVSLKEAVGHLTDRERKILSMRFFQGKTQMEVSAEIGISQAQVSRLEKNALRQIRKEM